jgi:hypothetical protein
MSNEHMDLCFYRSSLDDEIFIIEWQTPHRYYRIFEGPIDSEACIRLKNLSIVRPDGCPEGETLQ